MQIVVVRVVVVEIRDLSNDVVAAEVGADDAANDRIGKRRQYHPGAPVDHRGASVQVAGIVHRTLQQASGLECYDG